MSTTARLFLPGPFFGDLASGRRLRRARALMQLWRRRARTRRRLAELADWQLDDIGIDRAQALAEAGKPFWKA